MSRAESWEDDEPYPNASQMFQANVEKAVKGKRGQTLLIELEEALLAMPEKKLASSVVCQGGEVCALGALAVHRAVKAGKPRSMAMAELEAQAKENGQVGPEDFDCSEDETLDFLRGLIGIKAKGLAWTLVYENDNCHSPTPEARYERMLRWVQKRIVKLDQK